MNILFVGKENQRRSRTAESIFSNSSEHVVRSAGTSATARVKISQDMLLSADLVFCMETEQVDILKERFAMATNGLSLTVLHIEEEYPYMGPELVEELEEAMARVF